MGSSAVFSDRRRVGVKFDDAKVRSFVPLLVQRCVRDELGDTPTTP
jgi:hypothetical protein